MKKKLKEMTFLEFLKEAKKEGIESEVIDNFKREVLEILHREAFSDEQILEMKMERLYNFLIDMGEKYVMLWEIALQKMKGKHD